MDIGRNGGAGIFEERVWTGVGNGSFIRSGATVKEMVGVGGGERSGWIRDVVGREWRLPVLDVGVKI